MLTLAPAFLFLMNFFQATDGVVSNHSKNQSCVNLNCTRSRPSLLRSTSSSKKSSARARYSEKSGHVEASHCIDFFILFLLDPYDIEPNLQIPASFEHRILAFTAIILFKH